MNQMNKLLLSLLIYALTLILSGNWSLAEEINLITYFDCSDDDNITTLEQVEQCDIFAYLGAEVAKDVINSFDSVELQLHQTKLDSNNIIDVSPQCMILILQDLCS